jgi:hypothetical protein
MLAVQTGMEEISAEKRAELKYLTFPDERDEEARLEEECITAEKISREEEERWKQESIIASAAQNMAKKRLYTPRGCRGQLNQRSAEQSEAEKAVGDAEKGGLLQQMDISAEEQSIQCAGMIPSKSRTAFVEGALIEDSPRPADVSPTAREHSPHVFVEGAFWQCSPLVCSAQVSQQANFSTLCNLKVGALGKAETSSTGRGVRIRRNIKGDSCIQHDGLFVKGSLEKTDQWRGSFSRAMKRTSNCVRASANL